MLEDPVVDYFQEKEKSATERKQLDEQAFSVWKQDPSKNNLKTLYKRFEPDINKNMHIFAGGAKKINKTGLKMDMKRNLMTAFETWDPNKASLRTHANNLMKRSQRYVGKYQNIAFIPEEKRALITPINRAKDILQQQHDKEPSHNDIASYLNKNPLGLPKRVKGKVTPTLVKTVYDYQIKDIPGAAFEHEPLRRTTSFEREQASLLHTALTPKERNVYDYLTGRNGKPKIIRTGEIANRLGLSAPQVSRIRSKIESKYKKYLP